MAVPFIHLRDAVIFADGSDLLSPGDNAAGHVGNPEVAHRLEELRNGLTALTTAAEDRDFAFGVDLREPVGNVVLRNERAADIGDFILERLANIEDENVLARIEPPLQFPHAELGDSILQCRLHFGIRQTTVDFPVI